MTKAERLEAKELKRVERQCRKSLEARLERGEAITPERYGFDISPAGRLIKVKNDSCGACLLGSIVLDTLKSGCKVEGRSEFGGIDGSQVANKALKITVGQAYQLERGFMTDPYFDDQENLQTPWEKLGFQLRLDYYELSNENDENLPVIPLPAGERSVNEWY